jgi:dTDP-4-dehydrorhamnose reductase
MKIAILGGKGVLATALAHLCQKKGLDHLLFTKETLDITSLEALLRELGRSEVTHVINCAAYTDVDGAEKNRELAFLVNSRGAELVAVAARQLDLKVVHLSTDYVFDGKGERPYLETDRCSPVNTYGMSKWEGEEKLLQAKPDACVIRTSWIFGGGSKNFVSQVMRWMSQQEEVRAVDDQRGRPTWCPDLAEVCLSLLNASGIYHFANRGALSRYEIACDLFERAKAKGLPLACRALVPVPTTHFSTPAKRPNFSVLDTGKIEAFLQKPIREWKELLEEYLDGFTT